MAENQSKKLKRETSKCEVTEEELIDFRDSIFDIYNNGKLKKKSSGCDKVITDLQDVIVNLRNFLSQKAKDDEIEHSKVKEFWEQEENKIFVELSEIRSTFSTNYNIFIEELNAKILNIVEFTANSKVVKGKLLLELEYIRDFLTDGTKYYSRFDDDSFFGTAKTCFVARSVKDQLITIFHEISSTLNVISHEFPQSKCFESLRDYLLIIQLAISYQSLEKRNEALNSTYSERIRILRKNIDDYSLQRDNIEKSLYSELSDNVHHLLLQYNELKNEIPVLRNSLEVKKFEAITKMIRDGSMHRKAAAFLLQIRNETDESYRRALSVSYNCNTKYLHNTLRFAFYFDSFTGFQIIRNTMSECKQMDSPFILRVAYVLEDQSLDKYVQKVYDGWASHIRNQNFEQIKLFSRLLDKKVMNYSRLFRTASANESRDVKWILKFIDSLNV